MPFFWHHAKDNASATLITVATTTQTVLDTKGPHVRNSIPEHTYVLPAFHLLLLLGLPLVWYLAHHRYKARFITQNMVPRQNIEEWERPWKTSDWPTLFGLIGLANDNRWEHTPLWFYKSMHEKWHQHNRPWMKRLLAMGVIPLYIQDGGMEQYRVNFSGFGLKKRFPYFTWPRYIQSKKRAYFEFIIPYCDQNQDRLDFLQEIIVNRTQQVTGYEQAVRDNSYGVTVRIAPPGRGAIYYSIPNPPCLQERPFEIGAQSALELFVPFKRDTVLKRAFAERCNAMAYFFRDCDASRIPLLQHADTILVRLEAKHYGSCELDTYVYSVAERVGLPILWPEVECREAAVKELELCGLPADGLRPFQLSESAAFH